MRARLLLQLGAVLTSLAVMASPAWAHGGGGGHGGGGHGGGGHGGGGHGGGGFHGGGGGFHGGGGGFHGGGGGFHGGSAMHSGGMRAGGSAFRGGMPGGSSAFRGGSNFARGGSINRGGANFTQRNFSGGNFARGNFSGARGLAGSSNFAAGRGGANLGHANFTTRNFSQSGRGFAQSGRGSASFANSHFGATAHAGNFNRSGANGLVRGTNLHNANLAGRTNFNGGAGRTAGQTFASRTFGNNGFVSHGVNHSGFNNRAFNQQNFHNHNGHWSGGWNNWNNRSFFFGGRSPFGNYYRGYYPGWGRYGYGYGWYRPWFSFGFFPYFGYGWGWGYPYYGWGGWGYPGFGYASYLNGYGYGGYGGYGYPAYSSYSYGYPYGTYYGSGYPGYSTYDSYYAAAGSGLPAGYQDAPAPSPSADVAPGIGPNDAATAQNAPRSVDDITAADFAGQGEIDFKAGKYDAAARNFRHALVDDPANAGVLMLLGQSLFASGQYDEAAGATAMAMQALPQDKWGAVVENRAELYGNVAEYTSQVAALEKARDAKPDQPGLHFLLGFQYAYSGKPSAAIKELERTISMEPKDQMAKALRDLVSGKQNPTGANPPVPNPPPRATDL